MAFEPCFLSSRLLVAESRQMLKMSNQDVKSIVKRYFTRTDSQTVKWTCSCRKTMIQKKNSGWRNLFANIKSQHKDGAAKALIENEKEQISNMKISEVRDRSR